MIHDQASELRALIRQVRLAESTTTDSPRLIVVSSGAPGEGATCIATNLALALNMAGHRTVLVDADLDGAAATALCRVQPELSVADVLSGRCTAVDAIVKTSHGLQLLGGLWGSSLILDCTPSSQLRLIEQLRQLPSTDCVVIDVGCGRSHVVSDFWQAADLVLAVTTPDNESLVNTYSAIKVFGGRVAPRDLRVIVNRAANPALAHDVTRRLTASAKQFLDRTVRHLGSLPFDGEVELASRERIPYLKRTPQSPASVAIMQIASALGYWLQQDSEAPTTRLLAA